MGGKICLSCLRLKSVAVKANVIELCTQNNYLFFAKSFHIYVQKLKIIVKLTKKIDRLVYKHMVNWKDLKPKSF